MSATFPIPTETTAPARDGGVDGGSRGDAAERLLDGLNDPQRAAVVHAGTPLLVVAGAGSGKTRVLARRIAWLISERGAHPGSILAITFTNKAAAEMRERVEGLVGRRARVMWVSTFHAACVRILRKEITRIGFRSGFSIYDAADSLRLMTLVCRDLDLNPKRYPPKAVLGWVSARKDELVDVDDAAEEARNQHERSYADAYAAYQQRLRAADALDFDDLIMTTVQLLQAYPEVREAYRRRFRHVLVDEYQDTNHAQYAFVRELCGVSAGRPLVDGGDHDAPDPGSSDGAGVGPAELMVVGDADQSIYAFRGASIRNILQFEEDFPDAATILLEQNYRSTQTILDAANAVIGRNEGRKRKNLWSELGPGERLVAYVADDEHDEARFVAEEIDRLSDDGVAKPRDVAVFYRTNAQSRVFEEVFVRRGLPYKVVGGVRFYERKEVRDALAYLRMLANPADEISLRRVLNEPRRGIGDRAVTCVQALASRDALTFFEALQRADEAPGIATRSVTAIRGFVDMALELQAMVESGQRADVVLEQTLARSGYLAALEDSDDPQDQTRLENLAELVAVAREFADEPVPPPSSDPADLTPARPGVPEFLERVALVADSDQIPDQDAQDGGVVTLMTLHTAKGLEFPAVFLTGLEEGIFPHQRTLGDPKQLQEERRLAYVGLTRAQRRLHISRALVRSSWGAPSHNPASRFLDELPGDLVDWRRSAEDQTRWNRPVLSEVPARAASAIRRRFGAATARADAEAKAARPVPVLDPGDRVSHDTFGLGTVVTVEGAADKAVASIDFGSQGVKRLLLRYAPVEKL
jgi:DNA helicase-2/ATP-dependent DNA helicase PcrA